MEGYFDQKSRLSGSVMMQSQELQVPYKDEYLALKRKFEETIDNYEHMIKQTINQIQQLELSLDDRTHQLQFAVEARDKYIDELSKKNTQIEELSYLVSFKEKEIQFLKQRMQSGVSETNIRLELERQEHAHKVYELRKTITAQKSELLITQKQYSELENKAKNLQAKLKTHDDHCKSTKSSSQLKDEARLRLLISLRKERPKENQEPMTKESPCFYAPPQMAPISGALLYDQVVKESDHQILAPVNLSEELFEGEPKLNFSDLCRTPSSDHPSPTIRKHKLESIDSLRNIKDIFPLREVKNRSHQSVQSNRRASHSHIKTHLCRSESATKLEQMIKRPGCKNLSCECERKSKLPINSKRTCSSLCSTFWCALKAVVSNTSQLFSHGRENQTPGKLN